MDGFFQEFRADGGVGFDSVEEVAHGAGHVRGVVGQDDSSRAEFVDG